MTEFLIDSLNSEMKDLIINRLLASTSQRKIAEELKGYNVSISDVAIGRWWKENKEKYLNAGENIIDTNIIAGEVIRNLNKNTFQKESICNRLVTEKLLSDLILQYTVIVSEKTKLKNQGVENHYPSDLVSILKIIFELYFKIKDANSCILIEKWEELNHKKK